MHEIEVYEYRRVVINRQYVVLEYLKSILISLSYFSVFHGQNIFYSIRK